MFNDFKKRLAPPEFPGDAEKTQQARLINALGLYFCAVLVVAAVFFVPLFAINRWMAWGIIGILFVVYGISRYLLFRGQVEFSSSMIVMTIWAIVQTLAIFSGGLSSPLMVVVVAVIILIALLLPLRVSMNFVLISILIGLGEAALKTNGFEVQVYFVYPPLATWFWLLIAIGFVYNVVIVVIHSLRSLTRAAMHQSAALQQAEITLRSSEARFRAVVEHSYDGVIFLDQNRKMFYISPSYTQISGASTEEMLGQNSNDFIHPDDRAQVTDLFEELIQKPGETLSATYRVKHKAGSWRWVETLATNLFADPLVQAIVLNSHDITERKQAEDARRESQATLHAIIESTGDMIWSVDPVRFGLQTFNNGLKDYFIDHRGIRIELGMRPEDLYPAENYIELWYSLYQRALDEGSFTTEYTVFAGDAVLQLSFHLLKREGEVFGISVFGKDITEHKAAETALRESEKRYRDLFEKVPVGLYRTTLEGKVLDCNPIVLHMFGYATLDDIRAKNMADLWVHPEDRQYLFDQSKDKEVFDWEYEMRRSDGSSFWVHDNFRVVRNMEKKIIYFDGSLQDITDRKHAEEEVLKLKLGVEHSNDAIFVTDPSGRITYANPAFEQVYGFTEEEALGQTPRIIKSGLLSEQIYENFWATLVGKKTVAGVIINKHKNGNLLTIEGSNNPILDGSEKIVGYLAIHRDISERKKAEDELKQSQEQFRAVVRTANDAIITMNAQQEVVFWNEAAEKIFGYSEAEMLGKSVLQIIPQQFQQTSSRAAEQVFNQNRQVLSGRMIEATGMNNVGEEFPIEMSFAEWKVESGQFITAIIRNVKERKLAEERIQQSEKKYRELFQINKDGISIFKMSPDGSKQAFVELNDAAHQMLGYTKEEMLRLTPYMLEPSVTLQELASRQQELDSTGIVSFETSLLHKNGGRVFVEFTSQLIQYEGTMAILSIVHDITERKQRELELEAIATLSQAMRSAPTRAVMLPVIVEQMSKLISCDSISVEIIDPETQEAVVEGAYGEWLAIIGHRQPPGTGLNMILSQTRKPFHSNDVRNDPRIGIPQYLLENIRAGAGVPLIAQDHLIGFLWLGRKSDIPESDVRMLSAVADIAANAIYRVTLHEQTKRDASELAQAYDTTLEGWANALELRDQETEGHSQRVTEMTLKLAKAFGLDESQFIHIRRGAILHDIGKMGIPDAILHKPGPLTDEEWVIMRKYPQYAYNLLSTIAHLRPALDIPYCHHEKWDGTGYPRGLKGEEIPIAARVFAVVDVWDALRSDRPYRLAWPEEKVREYIVSQTFIQFDPKVVEVFLRLIDA